MPSSTELFIDVVGGIFSFCDFVDNCVTLTTFNFIVVVLSR
ncbi:hypothetical protein EHRUM4_03260 [Ehrlichia ruminantium]|nr:hypothetical protein EHRUM4_03260 [Ehrlichia ruminantium]